MTVLSSGAPSAMTYEEAQFGAQMLYIPIGMVLLFFGVFVIEPCLVALSCFISAHVTYIVVVNLLSFSPSHTAIAVCLAVVATLVYFHTTTRKSPSTQSHSSSHSQSQFRESYNQDRRMDGVILGVCIALTLCRSGVVTTVLAAIILSAAFGVVFSIVPREAAIFLTSYGGAFLMFFGMQLVDSSYSDTEGDSSSAAAAFMTAGRWSSSWYGIDVWLSVVCFLVVGLLGCSVQLVLLSCQAERVVSRYQYAPIP